MTPNGTMVRNLDADTWRQIRAESIRHSLSAGALLTIIANEWLAEHSCATMAAPMEPVERTT